MESLRRACRVSRCTNRHDRCAAHPRSARSRAPKARRGKSERLPRACQTSALAETHFSFQVPARHSPGSGAGREGRDSSSADLRPRREVLVQYGLQYVVIWSHIVITELVRLARLQDGPGGEGGRGKGGGRWSRPSDLLPCVSQRHDVPPYFCTPTTYCECVSVCACACACACALCSSFSAAARSKPDGV